MNLPEEALRLEPHLRKGAAFIYILQLRSGTLYVGCSTDFGSRLREHEVGTACRTTYLDPPLRLLFIELHHDFPSARAREAQIKKWSRAKKLALVSGDFSQLQNLSKSRETGRCTST